MKVLKELIYSNVAEDVHLAVQIMIERDDYSIMKHEEDDDGDLQWKNFESGYHRSRTGAQYTKKIRVSYTNHIHFVFFISSVTCALCCYMSLDETSWGILSRRLNPLPIEQIIKNYEYYEKENISE